MTHDFEAGLNDQLMPIKRYGATMVFDHRHSNLILSGGYMFDSSRMEPVWLRGDWWLGPLAQGDADTPFTWTQFQVGHPAENDVRYKSASAIVQVGDGEDSRMVIVGGAAHDGTTVVSDAIAVMLDTGEASIVEQHGDAPTPRLSTALIALSAPFQSAVLLYGGMSRGGAMDAAVYIGTLSLSSKDEVPSKEGSHPIRCDWRHATLSSDKAGQPPTRRAHIMLEVSATSMAPIVVVFGGFGEGQQKNLNDVWQLQADDHQGSMWSWHLLHDGGDGANTPTPRGAAVGAVHGNNLFVALGAACDISCTTLGDLWMFSLGSRNWTQLLVPEGGGPMHRQFASSIFVSPNWLYVFGGESFHPHAYWNDLWRLRLDNVANDRKYHHHHLSGEAGELRRTQVNWMPPIRPPMERPQRSIVEARGGVWARAPMTSPLSAAALVLFLGFILILRWRTRREPPRRRSRNYVL